MEEYKDIEIEGTKIPKELLEIIIKRIQAMPKNIKLAVLGEILTKEDIISQVRDNTPLGQKILKIEIGYYRDLFRNENAQ